MQLPHRLDIPAQPLHLLMQHPLVLQHITDRPLSHCPHRHATAYTASIVPKNTHHVTV